MKVPGVLFDERDGDAGAGVLIEHLPEEISKLRAAARWDIKKVSLDCLVEMHEVVTDERDFSEDKTVQGDTQSPDVGRSAAGFRRARTELRRVEGRRASRARERVILALEFLRLTKVRDLGNAIGGEQEVLWFDVTVYDLLCVQILKSLDDILKVMVRRLLSDWAIDRIALNGTAFQQLHYQVEIVIAWVVDDLVEPCDVLVMKPPHDCHLALHVLKLVVHAIGSLPLQYALIHLLDGIELLVVAVQHQLDLARCALPYRLDQYKFIHFFVTILVDNNVGFADVSSRHPIIFARPADILIF